MRYSFAIIAAAGLALGWAVVICFATFLFGMQLGQYHLHRADPMVRAGAWTADPKFKGCETRPIVLTNVWFTMATNQRRSTRDHRDISAYGDINVTYRPALWGSLAVSFTVPVGLALAAWRDRARRDANERGRLSM